MNAFNKTDELLNRMAAIRDKLVRMQRQIEQCEVMSEKYVSLCLYLVESLDWVECAGCEHPIHREGGCEGKDYFEFSEFYYCSHECLDKAMKGYVSYLDLQPENYGQ